MKTLLAILLLLTSPAWAGTVTLIAPTLDIDGNALVDLQSCRIDVQGQLGQTGSIVLSVAPTGGGIYPDQNLELACPFCRNTGEAIGTCMNSAGVSAARVLAHEFPVIGVPEWPDLLEPTP